MLKKYHFHCFLIRGPWLIIPIGSEWAKAPCRNSSMLIQTAREEIKIGNPMVEKYSDYISCLHEDIDALMQNWRRTRYMDPYHCPMRVFDVRELPGVWAVAILFILSELFNMIQKQSYHPVGEMWTIRGTHPHIWWNRSVSRYSWIMPNAYYHKI